jgi:hypothetical protein
MEVLLETVFSMWSPPRLYDSTDRVQFSSVNAVQWIGSSRLLLDSGSWGTGIIREPRVKGTSVVGRRYQITTGEDAGCKDLVRVIVKSRVCELAIALYLLVVAFYKNSVILSSFQNSPIGTPYTWHYLVGYVMTLCTLVGRYQRFGRTRCPHHQHTSGNCNDSDLCNSYVFKSVVFTIKPSRHLSLYRIYFTVEARYCILPCPIYGHKCCT